MSLECHEIKPIRMIDGLISRLLIDRHEKAFELVRELVDTKPCQNPLIHNVNRASQKPTNPNARWSYISAFDWPTSPVFELVQ